jgi:uncharacterized membrane protein
MAKKQTRHDLETALAECREKLEQARASAARWEEAASIDFDAIDARYLIETLRAARAASDLFWHHRAIDQLTDVLEKFA